MGLFERIFGKQAFDEIRPLVEGRYEQLMRSSIANARSASTLIETQFGVGSEDSWSFDQDDGVLVLQFATHTVRIAAEIVGSYSHQTGTWLWAWANEEVDRKLSTSSLAVREYGKVNAIDDLVSPTFTCEEQDGWVMAAIALSIGGGVGLYGGDTGRGRVFFLLKQIVA